MYSNNVAKALAVCDNHFSLILISCPENHLQTNKQLINLLYKDVKNLTSILNCYIHPKCQWVWVLGGFTIVKVMYFLAARYCNYLCMVYLSKHNY